MREIKCRAWDRETKKMTICRSLVEWLDAFAQFEYDTKNNQLSRVKQFVFMQYTGLKDKNGKEIYEGDIVYLIYNAEEHIYQVLFDETELDFKATNGENNYKNNFQYLTCCEEVEVIGNIYENKELLDVK